MICIYLKDIVYFLISFRFDCMSSGKSDKINTHNEVHPDKEGNDDLKFNFLMISMSWNFVSC